MWLFGKRKKGNKETKIEEEEKGKKKEKLFLCERCGGRFGKRAKLRTASLCAGCDGPDPDMQALVVDLGSGWIKAGFSGDDFPRSIFPSIVGREKKPGLMKQHNLNDFFVGDEAQSKRGILNLENPIVQGRVNNWEDFEKLLQHTIKKELRVNPEEHPMMLTEPPLNPKSNREKMAQLMFETFCFPALYIGVSSILSMYISGKSSGIVVESGQDCTYTVPIFEGNFFPFAVERMSIAGRSITERLVKILHARGYEMTTSAEKEIVNDIKEKMGYIVDDYESWSTQDEGTRMNSETSWEKEYELPDKTKMIIGSELFRAPEILFNPSLDLLLDHEQNNNNNIVGIHKMVINSIKKCDQDLRKEIFSNVVLAGGSTLFEGIVGRLATEIEKALVQEKKDEKDGSCIRENYQFQNQWIDRKMYDEFGPSVVNRK